MPRFRLYLTFHVSSRNECFTYAVFKVQFPYAAIVRAGTRLTDVLSAIRRYNLLYPLITGKTSLSKQRFPADVGYTFQGAVLSHRLFPGSFFRVPGSHLLSHAVSSIVSSAASVLTYVFGMGTGVSPKRIATGNLRSQLFSLITQQ